MRMIDREEYIRQKIFEQGYTVKSFAKKIGMPYSTLLSILKNSIGGAALDNVIRICNGLNITINELQAVVETTEIPLSLSKKEKEIILAYRARSDMQNAVDTLLGIQASTDVTDDKVRDLHEK